jgi:hypothetical protein
LFVGFLAGCWSSKPVEKISYKKGETVRDTIYSERLVPYKVEVPAKPNLPLKPDTIRLSGKPEIIAMKVDTAKIIADYIIKNSYQKTLFDNTKDGKFIFNAIVQYNQLQQIGYEFTPIQKTITIEKKPVLTPFLTVSYNTLGYIGTGIGIYYHDIGVSAKYLSNFNNTGYEFGINYKF